MNHKDRKTQGRRDETTPCVPASLRLCISQLAFALRCQPAKVPSILLHGGRRRICVTLTLLSTAFLSGCGYVVGGAYAPDIRSVHVPTFTSDSFRRDIELQLTEAVQKEIQERSPYRLTRSELADTRLTGHVIEVRKDVLGETMFDDPRELQFSLAVEVIWEDIRSGQVLAQQRVPLSRDMVQLVSQADFAPELGHSRATATQEAVDTLARQIVGMMEAPW